MNKTEVHLDAHEVQAISALYQKAAQELLHAYQCNKEATRHHSSGAFRAALHHARLSCTHSSAAHAHLAQALERSMGMSRLPLLANHAASLMAVTRDH